MIEIILKRRTAVLTKTGFADHVNIIGHFFTDAEADDAAGALFCQIGREGVVAIDDERHVRGFTDCLFESLHGQVDLTVAVELVAEETGEDHVVGLKVLQDPRGGGLVDFQARVVRIEIPQRSGFSRKCCGDTFEHVGTEPVGDDTKALRFEHGTEEIIGGRLAVGAAGHDDPATDLCRERRYDVRVDLESSPAGQRRAGLACQMTGLQGGSGSGDCEERAQGHG